MVEIENAENIEEIVVRDSLCAHGADGVGVDDLLAERAGAEVGTLRDVEDLGERWFADCATIDGPEAAKDTEERGFAASVRADYQDVVASFHGK
jgi:hypothetical protein